jgi:hypothetical protein
MSIFAVLIGGPNSVFGWILVAVMAVAFLFFVGWKRWPRPQLRKTPHGWELHRVGSATGPPRNVSQAALLSRLLIAVAVVVVVWLLLRSR